jgi:predicted CXXCH cytochrome family protein
LKPAEPWGPSSSGSPIPRSQDGVEVNACAPCHSRREPLKEGFIASDPFLDAFEPELLRPGRYHADGQVEGEVYEWASFLQSRMHEAGVRCSDCHDAHSGNLKAQGDDLCSRCHEPARFRVETHSHHAGPGAPRCIDCHMPPATFMQIDERRDHSIRIPRPDHSIRFGTPNACTGCHDEKTAVWARDRVREWVGSHERPHFVDALGKDRQGALDAAAALRLAALNSTFPSVARATALERLGSYPTQKSLETIQTALANPDPLVVFGAVLGAAEFPPERRLPLLLPALEHRSRVVRIAAGKALADVRFANLPSSVRSTLERAFAEVEASFDVSASRVETRIERGAFELARGNVAKAEAELLTALRFEPCLVEAHLNIADLLRGRGDEARAERALRAALACNPESAAAHHALGLWLVRTGQKAAAVTSLRKASALAPTDTRFSFVLAVALGGEGRRAEAIRVLEAALALRPNDANALQALASYLHEDGQVERAAEVQQALDKLVRE